MSFYTSKSTTKKFWAKIFYEMIQRDQFQSGACRGQLPELSPYQQIIQLGKN